MKVKVYQHTYFVKVHQKDDAKPTILFLHGFMGSHEVFSDLIPIIKYVANPIGIDLLGHGRSSKFSSSDPFETSRQVDDLFKLINKITDAPPYLYGYSMGGRLALQFASAHPEMLKGLILESSNSGLTNAAKRKQRNRQDNQRARAIKNDFETFLDDWQKLPLFNNHFASEETLNHYRMIQLNQDPHQMAYSLQSFGSGVMPAVSLDKIKIPVLLMAGENDEKYVKIMSQMQKNINKSRLEIIPGAGHRVHVDQPKDITDKLKDFTC